MHVRDGQRGRRKWNTGALRCGRLLALLVLVVFSRRSDVEATYVAVPGRIHRSSCIIDPSSVSCETDILLSQLWFFLPPYVMGWTGAWCPIHCD